MILFRFVKEFFYFYFLFLISFGISNKELLHINLWPFSLNLQIPAYLFLYCLVDWSDDNSVYSFLIKKMTINSNQIICALDFDDFSKAENFIKAVDYDIVYKIGMEFFYRFGIEGIKKISYIKKNIKLFLDLKLHDIPNTVERAIYPLVTKVRPYMLTLHVAGGEKMLQNAVLAATDASKNSDIEKPLLG